ncbi:MAG TPA: hypothetical protein PKA41_12300 [Verrucomicrobiota bacterium]|nr:hypothetical protein [Verrucomicrobiota bacterium]
MKKLIAVVCGCLLTAGVALAAEATEADQKWLSAVTKMVESGKTQISTPSETRADLLKSWAKENGFSVSTSKSESSIKLELSKQFASK